MLDICRSFFCRTTTFTVFQTASARDENGCRCGWMSSPSPNQCCKPQWQVHCSVQRCDPVFVFLPCFSQTVVVSVQSGRKEAARKSRKHEPLISPFRIVSPVVAFISVFHERAEIPQKDANESGKHASCEYPFHHSPCIQRSPSLSARNAT